MKEIFELFCDKDSDRVMFHEPFQKDGITYGTDAYKAIFCKNDVLDFTAKELIQDANLSSLKVDAEMFQKICITLKDFEPFKTVPITKEVETPCNECGGCGQVDWEYLGHYREDDCPECNGVGNSESFEPTGEMGFGDQKIKINDAYFYLWNFEAVLKAAEMTAHSLFARKIPKNGPCYFSVERYNIVVMPVNVHGNDKTDCVIELNCKPESK